jgi:hypothetical protein
MSRRIPPNPATAASFDANDLNAKRLALVDAIERLRNEGRSLPPLVDKARRLMLGRYWAKADWRRRAQILATSEWLIRLAEMSGDVGKPGLF